MEDGSGPQYKKQSMYKIAIIGAGQLGSRHLQGLKLAKLPMDISIIDSSQQSLDVARSRYEEIEVNPQINSIEFIHSIDELPNELDLVIIATSSSPRRAIIEQLITTKEIKNLLLEKFLFPAISDYQAIEKLLATNDLLSHTWINCPSRIFEGYIKLSKECQNDKPIEFSVAGSDWGLACNSIHFIDLFAMLKGNAAIDAIDISKLDPEIYPSKRADYVEFMGEVSVTTSRGDKLNIICRHNDPRAMTKEFKIDNNLYIVDDATGKITKNGQPWSNLESKYQSALTGTVTEHILGDGNVGLPLYYESAKLHVAFLKALVPFYNNLSSKQGDSCPIT